MWDWELLKNGSGKHHYEIISRFGNEDFQYTHAISYGTQEDEFCLHNHAMYELVYCLCGNVVYLAEGVQYPLEPDSLLIINPTVPHKLFICSDVPFERHIIYIYYACGVSQMAGLIARCQPPLVPKHIGSAYYPPKDVSGLRHLMTCMSQASSSPDPSVQALTVILAQAMVAELAMIMWNKQPAKYSEGTSKTVDTLLTYLSQNYNHNLTLRGIADTFHLSKDYCNRLFRSATGMTVMQYIMYSRVLHAKQLLAEGTPATETAKMVGYGDYSSFFRAYRKITGRTPRDDHEIPETMLTPPEY